MAKIVSMNLRNYKEEHDTCTTGYQNLFKEKLTTKEKYCRLSITKRHTL